MDGAATIILFEDAATLGLSPLADLRPAFELRVGSLNLRERLEIAAPTKNRRAVVRPQLRPLLRQSLPEWAEPIPGASDVVLLLNARLRASIADLRAWCAKADRPCRSGSTTVIGW